MYNHIHASSPSTKGGFTFALFIYFYFLLYLALIVNFVSVVKWVKQEEKKERRKECSLSFDCYGEALIVLL